MIKIDKDITNIEGTAPILATEMACLFKDFNKIIDGSVLPKLMEELVVCCDEQFAEFCKLAVRLNEAHKRVEEKTKRRKQ